MMQKEIHLNKTLGYVRPCFALKSNILTMTILKFAISNQSHVQKETVS